MQGGHHLHLVELPAASSSELAYPGDLAFLTLYSRVQGREALADRCESSFELIARQKAFQGQRRGLRWGVLRAERGGSQAPEEPGNEQEKAHYGGVHQHACHSDTLAPILSRGKIAEGGEGGDGSYQSALAHSVIPLLLLVHPPLTPPLGGDSTGACMDAETLAVDLVAQAMLELLILLLVFAAGWWVGKRRGRKEVIAKLSTDEAARVVYEIHRP